MRNRVVVAMVLGVMCASGLAALRVVAEEGKKDAPNVVGAWTGQWGPFNPAREKVVSKENCKVLDCVVTEENGVWKAEFSGECGRPYRYNITMEGRLSGGVVLFRGSADLGEKDGGVYDWVGRATEEEFIGFYTSGHVTGVFFLSRAKGENAGEK